MIMLILVIHGVISFLTILFVIFLKFLTGMEISAPSSTITMNINHGVITEIFPLSVATRKCSLEHVLETSARDYGMNAIGYMSIVFAVILGIFHILLILRVTISVQIAAILYVRKRELAMSLL